MTAPGGPGHVVLVGLSGSGKSTIGKLLARRLDRPFVDTDELIVQRAGKTIPEVFAGEGEAAFRQLEREAVANAVSGPASVIATGGGAPVDESNRAALWRGNTVVWLAPPVDRLVERLGAESGRPLLEGNPRARLTALYQAREPIYRTAHVRVSTEDPTPEETVAGILKLLPETVPLP